MADIADFEKASRTRLRFDTAMGQLLVEDLWDLPLSSETRVNLDSIARGLHNRLKQEDVSFVEERKSDEVGELSFRIVKHVIDVKVAERKAAENAQERAGRKQKILEIMAAKQDESLRGKTLAELEEELAAL